jgi:translocation and assembly module TamB
MNVTLGGDLVATKDPGEAVRLVGTVNAVRGTYQFQGRQFTILRDGLIRFNGDPIDQLNPTLDVRTQRMIQGVQANANIRGTLRRPRIQLTSVPPLERADIFSLIVFNQPVNQLGEGQQISLGQRAEQLALGSIAGGLSSSLGNLLNVSEFQLQTSPDSNSAAQLTVGQQVSQNLFVKVEYSVGDVSTTNLVLEYELRKWLRLQTNLIQAASAQQALFQAVHDSGFDLIFTFTR